MCVQIKSVEKYTKKISETLHAKEPIQSFLSVKSTQKFSTVMLLKVTLNVRNLFYLFSFSGFSHNIVLLIGIWLTDLFHLYLIQFCFQLTLLSVCLIYLITVLFYLSVRHIRCSRMNCVVHILIWAFFLNPCSISSGLSPVNKLYKIK